MYHDRCKCPSIVLMRGVREGDEGGKGRVGESYR